MKKRLYNRIPYRGRLLLRHNRLRRANRPPTYYFRGSIFVIAATLFVLFQFAVQLSSGEIVDGLMRSFHLSALGGAVLASSYYYVYVLLQVPAGMMTDSYGPRRLLSVGAFCCASGALLFANSEFIIEAVAGRLMMGLGGAFAFVGTASLISKWFPHRFFSRLVGALESISMLISLVATIQIAHLVQSSGWRTSIWIAGFLGIGITVVLWFVIRDAPPRAAPTSIPPAGQLWLELKDILKTRAAWANAFYSGLVYGVVTVFTAFWAIPYLRIEHHLDLVHATSYANATYIGIAIGCPLMGWLDSRLARRQWLLVSCSVMALVCILLVLFDTSLSLSLVGVFMVLLGLFSSAYIIPFTVGHQLATPYTKAASIGFVNTISVGTAPVFQVLVGFLLNHFAIHQNGHLSYTVLSYQLALLTVPIMLVGAAFCALFIPNQTKEFIE